MLQIRSRVFWKWSIFCKACNKQNTWECRTGCGEQRLLQCKDWQCKKWKLILVFQKLLCPRFWHKIVAWVWYIMQGENHGGPACRCDISCKSTCRSLPYCHLQLFPVLHCVQSILMFNNWLPSFSLLLICSAKSLLVHDLQSFFTPHTLPQCVQPYSRLFLCSCNMLTFQSTCTLCRYIFPFIWKLKRKQIKCVAGMS